MNSSIVMATLFDIGRGDRRLGAWTLAWNRWCLPSWRSVDVSAVVLAAGGLVAAVMPSASVTSASRFGSIALFLVIGARIARSGSIRITSA